MKPRQLTLGIFLWIVLNDCLDSIAQLCMKSGLSHIGIDTVTFYNATAFFHRSATSPLVWMGILIYALNFLTWIIVLSRLDVSAAVPLTSTNYIVLPLLAMVVLHEHMNLGRWLGILLIVAGMSCVAHSTLSSSDSPDRTDTGS